MVLIAGLGDQLVFWNETFCAELVGAGLRVLRFDNRDVGLSTKFDVGYTLDDMAGDVRLLLDELHIDSAHVVGASMGGWIAQKLAVAHPGRVRTMTLLMTWNGDKSVWKPQPQALEAMSAPTPKERDGYIEHARRLATIIGSPGTGEMAAAYAATTFDRGLHPAGVLNQMLATQKAEDWSSTLSSLDVPTVVIHGRRDPFFPPACGEATARCIPNASFHVLAGRGHDLPWGVEAEVAQLIADLARRCGGAHFHSQPCTPIRLATTP